MTTAARKPSEAERTIRQFEIINLVLLAVAVVVTHLLAGPGPFLWGVIVAGVLGALNLRAMVFVGKRILTSRYKSRAFWAAIFGAKLIVLCTAVWLCLSYLPIQSLGFLVGFSTVLPATLVLTVVRALERPPEATPHPTPGERRS